MPDLMCHAGGDGCLVTDLMQDAGGDGFLMTDLMQDAGGDGCLVTDLVWCWCKWLPGDRHNAGCW